MGNYFCNCHNRKFKTEKQLEKHIYDFSYTKKEKCPICDKIVKSLRSHLAYYRGKEHKKEVLTNFVCQCHGKEFKTRNNLNSHLGYYKLKKVNCPICNEEFSNKYILETHLDYYKDKKHGPIPDCCQTLICFCHNIKFKTKRKLRSHLWWVNNKNEIKEKRRLSSLEKLVCPCCNGVYRGKYALVLHNWYVKNRKNVSKKIFPAPFEQKCLDYLNKVYPNKFKYAGDRDFVEKRSVDAYSEELRTVALFQGDYWHCNPDKYQKDYYHPQIKKTAEQIWERDKETKEIIEKAGYKVMYIWEKDLNNLIKK